jgi:hypothetical protein
VYLLESKYTHLTPTTDEMNEDIGKKQLGNLASITAAIETTQTEIRNVQIQAGTEIYEARVQSQYR